MRLSTEFVRWFVETATTITDGEIRQVNKYIADHVTQPDRRKIADHLIKVAQAARSL